MRKVKPEHATRVALIDCGVELAKEFGMYGFTVEQLLTTSGISKGSLYHHFEDFIDLVECVQVRLFAKFVAEDIASIRGAFEAATDQESFRTISFQIAENAFTPERTKSRMDRSRIVSATQGRERFAKRIASEQKLLSDELAAAIQTAQEHGWASRETSPEAMALLLQAYTFGLLLNDISEVPLEAEVWMQLIRRVYDRALFGD